MDTANVEPASTKQVIVRVTAFIPDFNQTRVMADDGHQYAVARNTAGLRWDQLHEGQRIRCRVTVEPFPRCVEVLELL